jgi:hypothetical protein
MADGINDNRSHCNGLFNFTLRGFTEIFKKILASLLITLFLSNQVAAIYPHPVSISSALVELSPQRVRVELQIMLEDLVLYHNLAADGEMNYSISDLTAAAHKHRQFVKDYFSILDVDGNRLLGKIEDEVFEQIGTEPVPQGELMKRSISFLLHYDLEQEKPQYLTFLQTFGGPKSALPSMMDLYITRNEMFEESAQIAFNRPHTVKIDWSHNPEGKKLSLAELRQIRREQLRDRLGIGSFSGLYSFLYINRFEVRHEVLIPLMTLDHFVPIERADQDFLEIEEQLANKPAIQEFFETHGQVLINDVNITPKVQRISFFSLDISDFALNAEPRRIGVHQGRVGVIISYPSSKTPEKVSVEWDKFNEFAPFIDMTLLIGTAAPERTYFHPQATKYEWQGSLTGSVPLPIKATLKLNDQTNRIKVTQSLLENIYRAFDFRQDDEVYDSLASCVKGSLLRDLYLQIKRSLILAEQGGDLSHVLAVEVLSSKPIEDQSAVYDTTWKVTSVSEHWGHIHKRTSEYRAEMNISQHEGNWKLDKFLQLDEKRLSFETSIRGNDKAK